MKITPEVIEAGRKAASPEELARLAKKLELPVPEEAAEEMYSRLHGSAALSDNELENVSGGCGDIDYPEEVTVDNAAPRCVINNCGGKLNQTGAGSGGHDSFNCEKCGRLYQHYWYGDMWIAYPL